MSVSCNKASSSDESSDSCKPLGTEGLIQGQHQKCEFLWQLPSDAMWEILKKLTVEDDGMERILNLRKMSIAIKELVDGAIPKDKIRSKIQASLWIDSQNMNNSFKEFNEASPPSFVTCLKICGFENIDSTTLGKNKHWREFCKIWKDQLTSLEIKSLGLLSTAQEGAKIVIEAFPSLKSINLLDFENPYLNLTFENLDDIMVTVKDVRDIEHLSPMLSRGKNFTLRFFGLNSVELENQIMTWVRFITALTNEEGVVVVQLMNREIIDTILTNHDNLAIPFYKLVKLLDFEKCKASITNAELAQLVNLEDLRLKSEDRWDGQQLVVPSLVKSLSMGYRMPRHFPNNLTKLEFKSAAKLNDLYTKLFNINNECRSLESLFIVLEPDVGLFFETDMSKHCMLGSEPKFNSKYTQPKLTFVIV